MVVTGARCLDRREGGVQEVGPTASGLSERSPPRDDLDTDTVSVVETP